VFPLVKPALNLSHGKAAGRKFMNAEIYINKQSKEDLLEFMDQAESLEGIQMLCTEGWTANEGEFQIWGDASVMGMAFFFPLRELPVLQT
jgi:hypothetical protein